MKDPEISNLCSERLFARHDSIISHTNSYQLLLHMPHARPAQGQTRKNKQKQKQKPSLGGEGASEVPIPAVDLLGVNSP